MCVAYLGSRLLPGELSPCVSLIQLVLGGHKKKRKARGMLPDVF